MGRALELIRRLEANVGRALVGKPEVVRLAVLGLLARGHLLIEDVPGVGKTTLAAALARSIGGRLPRLPFTPRVLSPGVLRGDVGGAAGGGVRGQTRALFPPVGLAGEVQPPTPP